MKSEPSNVSGFSSWARTSWIAAEAVGVVGVLAVHHPMLLSGFGRIQTDRGDTRLIHYLLEHGYLWATGEPGHSDFWTSPFFHPLRNTVAYSDPLLSFGPFYWAGRIAGAGPDLAFGLWMVAMTVLNYAAGLLVFGGALGFGPPAAVAAAGLLAFGSPRVNQLGHQQLLPTFYVLLTFHALVRLFREDDPSPGRRLGLWMLAAFGAVAQLYGGVYLGWFLVMGVVLATILALASRSTRGVVLAVARRDMRLIAAAGVAAGVAMWPFLAHYLPAARELGSVYWPFRYYPHPTLGSWWNVGEGNWCWGWLIARRPLVGNLLEQEHRLGFGFLTTAASAAGLYLGRGLPWCRVAIWFLFVCLLSTNFLPNRELLIASSCLCCVGFGLLLRRDDAPLASLLAYLLILGVVAGVPFPNPWLRGVSLAVLVMCAWTLGTKDEDRASPAIATGLIGLKLFALEAVATIAVPVVVAAALAACLLPAHRRVIWLGAGATVLSTLILLTFAADPFVLAVGLFGGLGGLAASVPSGLRLPPKVLLYVLASSLAILVFLYDPPSIWLGYSLLLPGGLAIRAVGRIILILMIPAGVGLALLVDRLSKRQSAALAWTVALVCLAEQTTTTPSFDAAANRATIAKVVDRVKPGVATFYYKPAGESHIDYGLDAMWASLAVDVPTINGYTGYFPPSWSPFLIADSKFGEPMDVLLRRWAATHGLRAEDVQLLGEDGPAEEASGEGTGLAPTGTEPLR